MLRSCIFRRRLWRRLLYCRWLILFLLGSSINNPLDFRKVVDLILLSPAHTVAPPPRPLLWYVVHPRCTLRLLAVLEGVSHNKLIIVMIAVDVGAVPVL